SLPLLALITPPARAHFLWLLEPATEARAEKKPEEDPAASKLLADARAARASWENFPGFSADLQINVDGKITRGSVDVDAKGKVALTGIDDSGLEKETLRELRSVVSHRLDGSASLKTPCAF